jgi:hypothetical protein
MLTEDELNRSFGLVSKYTYLKEYRKGKLKQNDKFDTIALDNKILNANYN